VTEKALQEARFVAAQGLRDPYFALGVAYVYLGARPGLKFSADYEGLGEALWNKVRWQVYGLLCKDGAPKFWAQEAVGGDIRELIVNVGALLSTKLSIPASFAVPLAALAAKRGLKTFCRQPPEANGRTTIQVVLKDKQDHKHPLQAAPTRQKRAVKKSTRRKA